MPLFVNRRLSAAARRWRRQRFVAGTASASLPAHMPRCVYVAPGNDYGSRHMLLSPCRRHAARGFVHTTTRRQRSGVVTMRPPTLTQHDRRHGLSQRHGSIRWWKRECWQQDERERMDITVLQFVESPRRSMLLRRCSVICIRRSRQAYAPAESR